MNLLIIGAGGHGQVVKETAEATKQFDKIDFLDDHSPLAIGKCDEYLQFQDEYKAIFVAIGNNEVRKSWLDQVSQSSFTIPTIIHPLAYVSPSVQLAVGIVVLPFAVIHTNTHIQRGCIIGVGSIVDHDSTIGECCHINSGALVSSNQRIAAHMKIERPS